MTLHKHLQLWAFIMAGPSSVQPNSLSLYVVIRCRPNAIYDHYESMSMQYTGILFSAVKIENFVGKFWIFLILLLKTLIVGTR